MADNISKLERSRVMATIKSVDTRPELVVRKLVYLLGYRYRVHMRSLPGCPDIVFASRRKIINVNGCFWHRHRCKAGQSTPASRREYWLPKFSRNQARDQLVRRALRKAGWQVLTVWECQLRHPERVRARLAEFLVKPVAMRTHR